MPALNRLAVAALALAALAAAQPKSPVAPFDFAELKEALQRQAQAFTAAAAAATAPLPTPKELTPEVAAAMRAAAIERQGVAAASAGPAQASEPPPPYYELEASTCPSKPSWTTLTRLNRACGTCPCTCAPTFGGLSRPRARPCSCT